MIFAYCFHHFIEHRTNSNVFICWWSNSNTLFLSLNDRTSNVEPNRAFTALTKLLIELTRTSLFWTSNELDCIHLFVIELKHPIFGFDQSKFEHCLTHLYKFISCLFTIFSRRFMDSWQACGTCWRNHCRRWLWSCFSSQGMILLDFS